MYPKSPHAEPLNKCPLDLMVGDPPGQEPQECPIAYVEWIRQTMIGAHAVVYEALGQAAMRQRDIKHRRFEKVDWVWRYYPPKVNQKLGLAWDGPYLVLGVLTPWIYKIQKGPTNVPVNIHVDQLKPYEGSGHPSDWTIEEPVSEPSDDGEADVTLVAVESEPEPVSEPSDDGEPDVTLVAEKPGREPEPAPTRRSVKEPVIPFVPRSCRKRRIKPRDVFSPS